MQTRQFGNTDMNLTTVGLGTWVPKYFGSGPWQYGWGPQDDDEAIAAILKALDIGPEASSGYIGTAPAYGCGHSEPRCTSGVGKALKGSPTLASARKRGGVEVKQKPLIATKCGLLCSEKKEKVCCLKRESIRSRSQFGITRA